MAQPWPGLVCTLPPVALFRGGGGSDPKGCFTARTLLSLKLPPMALVPCRNV